MTLLAKRDAVQVHPTSGELENPQPSVSARNLSRRHFLKYSAVSGGILALAACAAPAPAPAAAPAEEEVAEEAPAEEAAPAQEEAAPADEDVTVMAGDVQDYLLSSSDWEGGYGWVLFGMHEALHNGESVYFIRTDGSDPGFAEENGLVYVPLLNAGAAIDTVNTLCMFNDDRTPIVAMAPGDENYSSLFQVLNVTVNDEALELGSHEDVMAAMEDGAVEVEMSSVYVNYPMIKWSDGELSTDSDLKEVLPGGQLFEAPDTDAMTVRMKLHQCYPGSRYILTDTGAVPMAGMMNIPASAPTNQLKELGGTDEIWVFGNGLVGPGVMGRQPAIFDNQAGDPAWSPFWDHFTLTWVDESAARLLTNSTEIRELVEAGELEQWNGVPDSHPNGFVVNCPAPILAPTDYEA